MAQEIVNALLAILCEDKNARLAGEQAIENLSCQSGLFAIFPLHSQQGFGVCLAQIALSEEVPVHIRQVILTLSSSKLLVGWSAIETLREQTMEWKSRK